MDDICVDLQDLDDEFFNISCDVLHYNDVGIAVTAIDREFGDEDDSQYYLMVNIQQHYL